MSTMNVDIRRTVYPHFHDTQSVRRSNKDIEIDNSVYHLLSLYLNADNMLSLPQPNKKSSSPYWKSKCPPINKRRHWLGEGNAITRSKQDLLLESNTMKNATRTQHYDDGATATKKKSRSKSVSFNETVVVIPQDTHVDTSIEEDVFEDALEHF